MVVFLFNTVIYVFLLLCVCILVVCLRIFIVSVATLQLPWLRFFRAFSSVVRQMLEYNSQRRGTARTLPKMFVLAYVLFVFCRSVYCLCVNVYCTAANEWQTNCSLTNISYNLIFAICVCACVCVCVCARVISVCFLGKQNSCHTPAIPF